MKTQTVRKLKTPAQIIAAARDGEPTSLFNWFDALATAEANPGDIQLAGALARCSGNWVTCACGYACRALPRRVESNAPADNNLRILGHYFHEQVKQEEWTTARGLLAKIEERASTLLAAQAKL